MPISERMANSLSHISDEELYAMLCRRDTAAHAAFEELYARHSSRVYTYCRRMLNNTAPAEDTFQETFVRLYNSAQTERTMTNVGAYLLRIARNLCLNEKQKKHHSMLPLEEFDFPARHPSYESVELAQIVETAVEALPEEYREVLIFREYLGLSYNEIADVLSTSMPVVRTRIYRAKAYLRNILAPYIEDLQK